MGLELPECPCGREHERVLTRDEKRGLARRIKREGDTVVIKGYRVPRVWLAYHFVTPAFPVVAKLAKFEKIDPPLPPGDTP